MRFFLILHILIIVLANSAKFVSCGSILFYMPFCSKSMKITFMPLAEEMARKGHEVVVLMPYPTKKPNPKVKEIIIDGSEWDEMQESISNEKLKTGADATPPVFELVNTATLLNDRALGHAEIKNYLKLGKKFDIVMVNAFLVCEGGYYLAKKFDASTIIYSTGQVGIPWADSALGNPHNPSYVPNPLMESGTEMNFRERLLSFLLNGLMEYGLRNYYILGIVNQMLDKHFPGETRPHLLDLERNASAVFAFTHPFIADGWRPTNPNYVDLGMMNCRAPKEINDDPALRKFLDEASEGVIYVSFGSVLKASVMSDDKRQAFLSVFGKLKQKVLWKWEIDHMENQPSNVMLHKWLPQQDVLGHPNVKLFVSHGGQSSFQETVCHQKPALFIPVQGDQPANAKEAERIGFGERLPYQEISEKTLQEKLVSMLNNPRYTNRAKEFGALAVDQIEHPLERATWWLEHIMRHPHEYRNKSPVLKLTWYQYFCLDVILTIMFAVLSILYIIYRITKLCSSFFGKKVKRE